MHELTGLKKSYQQKKAKIKMRLREFKKVWQKSEKDIFAELCFCLLTPQSKAEACWEAISDLKETGILFNGTMQQIRKKLIGVRFHNKKAKYIIKARALLQNGKIKIKAKINEKNIFETREWLVRNVKGLGYKEASHFLRNIGFYNDIAIIDRHILKNLKKFGVIDNAPKTLTKKRYIEIEEKMKVFAEKIGIPFPELDLLFWSEETGKIFK